MLQGMNSLPRARMMNQLNREVGAGDYRPELSNSYAGNIPRSNELDNLTLLQRRSLLLKSKLQSRPHHLTSDAAVKEGKEESPPFMDALAIKNEDKHIDSQVPGFMCSSSSQQDASSTKKYAPDLTNIGNISDPLDSTKVKVEPYDENHLLSHQKTALSGSDAVSTEQNGKVQDDDGWCDQLDHVPLINRREMLLVSKQLLCMNGTYSCISQGCEVPSVIHHSPSVKEEEGHCDSLGTGENLADLIASSVNEVIHPISENFKTGNELHRPGERHDADTCRSSVIGVNLEVQTSDVISSSKRKSSKLKRCIRSDHMPLNKRSFPKSTLGTAVKVKIEPSDHTEVLDSKCVAVGNFTFNSLSVKRETEVQNHLFEDNLDHMLLRERMTMLTSRADSGSECDWLATTLPAYEKISAVLESVKPIKIKHPRKRRKTVTDSVETALEEDAPGLLRVLLDNGVSVDELKLYGDIEDDDTLSDFAELEEVISKLFSQRQMHLKFGPLRSGKDTRTTYCLACLFSLVEQTRYLQFRKWPVEWGWCRDLQSFIFVFERHKRIVLERPEYGYATYFFELVDSLPIVWQIKRLVIAMKLTSCSRVSLIENKGLRIQMRAICAHGEKRLRSLLRRPEAVGQDLTEGEARVLMEYGWRPSSGLGTMLNYCDRVVHDRKNEIEKDTSEWRAKIGKLLMDGYGGGAIISRGILKKVIEYKNPESAEVKLEL